MTEEELKLRNSRQETLAPYEKLKNSECVVVGSGAVGRNVAKQLASLGVKSLQIWDHDTVEIENLAPQGYNENQLKKNKAEVTGEDCVLLNSSLDLKTENRRFARSDYKNLMGKFVFLCVDSIDTRKHIYDSAIKAGAKWIGDTRVAGEVIRIITETNPKVDSKYSTTLFNESEVFVGSCHAKMFTPGAMVAAGAVVAKFTQALRESLDAFTDHNINLSDWDLFETP